MKNDTSYTHTHTQLQHLNDIETDFNKFIRMLKAEMISCEKVISGIHGAPETFTFEHTNFTIRIYIFTAVFLSNVKTFRCKIEYVCMDRNYIHWTHTTRKKKEHNQLRLIVLSRICESICAFISSVPFHWRLECTEENENIWHFFPSNKRGYNSYQIIEIHGLQYTFHWSRISSRLLISSSYICILWWDSFVSPQRTKQQQTNKTKKCGRVFNSRKRATARRLACSLFFCVFLSALCFMWKMCDCDCIGFCTMKMWVAFYVFPNQWSCHKFFSFLDIIGPNRRKSRIYICAIRFLNVSWSHKRAFVFG